MAKHQGETHTLQTWPRGASYEYRGDLHGPAAQRRLRTGHYQRRLRCEAGCRQLLADMATPETARALPEAIGRYVTPGGGDDWTVGVAICPTCHGDGYITNPKRNPWRRGTAAEWREIRIARLAEGYQRHEVLTCQTVLISDLMAYAGEGGEWASSFAYDSEDLHNLRPNPSDWDAATCREWLEDKGIDLPDVPTVDCPRCDGRGVVGRLHAPCPQCSTGDGERRTSDGEIPDPDADDDDDYVQQLRDLVNEHAEDAEVYEWWLITSWLAEELRAIGEVVLDNTYGQWWGRRVTGQQFIMDGTLQRVATQYVREGE